jgi:hypothetical protein
VPHESDAGIGHDIGNVANEGVEILYGVEDTTKAIVKFIDKTNLRYNVYADSKTPSFVMNNEDIRTKFFEFKNKRGGYIRYITEITNENIDYCKQLMKVVDLRHIEGPRGVFRVNETEYHYNAVLDESKHVAVIIRSNLKQLVIQQQNVFDILWDKAVPAQDRLREIEDDQRKGQRPEGNPATQSNSIKTSGSTTADPALKIIEQQQIEIEIEEEKKNEMQGQRQVQLTPVSQDSNHHPQGSRKIQLWSDSAASEYAIRLDGESEFLASTSEGTPNIQYTNLLEEVGFFEDLKYDWNYTLKQWIGNRHNYGNNRSTSVYDDQLNTNNKFDQSQQLENKVKSKHENNKIAEQLGHKQIPEFKCHFCKLVFSSSTKRKKHEYEWHSSNVISKAS